MELLGDILIWGGGTVFIVFLVIQARKWAMREIEQAERPAEKLAEPEYHTVTVNATVIDQACAVKTIGLHTPETVKEFIVVFRTVYGDILQFDIPEEMYDGLEKGQTGMLTIVDGELYGFELDKAE